MSDEQHFKRLAQAIRLVMLSVLSLVLLIGMLLGYYAIDPTFSMLSSSLEPIATTVVEDENKIENGIHVRTGLVDAEGLMTVVNNCTNCHSSKLIIQNRMDEERWNATIQWMQETQNLWPLGKNQEVIVNYLVTNYPPKSKGRRENLSNIEWYELEN